MISVPKTVCPPCETMVVSQKLFLVPIIEDCYCIKPQVRSLAEKIDTNKFCYCPIPEKIETSISGSPKPIPRLQTHVCYSDFIKNITSTKLCVTGPQCK